MEDTQDVSVLIDSTTSKIQQLQKAFTELESHRAVTLNFKWKELEAHFRGLEKSLKRRFHEVEDQEKEYETKTMKAQEVLKERKAALVAKEDATLEKLQEKRDAAVFAITIAREKHRRLSGEGEEYSVDGSEGQSGTSMEETPATSVISEITSAETSGTVEDGSPEVQSTERGHEEVMSFPELVKLCGDMDAEGLHKFISDNRKNLASMREEIPQALSAATDPACLVLNSLDNFYRGVSNLDAKKDSSLLGLRRTCIMLMECLRTLLVREDDTTVSNLISEEIKARAKTIAEAWKPKLNELDMEAGSGNSLEAHAFLQLLDTFGIASDFDTEELTKLVPLVSRRRQAADLCRSLGLSDKMPGVIEVLINNGRHIDAVNLAFQFELTEKFLPVPMLQSFLSEARKVTSPSKAGTVSSSSTFNNQCNEVNERELSAIRMVIKCIEEHKLEEQFPVDTLVKRMLALEKAKADKKQATEVPKPQSKRHRATTAGYGPRNTNIAPNTSPYTPPRPTDRYPHPYVFNNRPYIYSAGPADNHCPPIMGAPAYGFPPPGHGNYYSNGYQYQGPAYLH